MERDYLIPAKRQAEELTATMQEWCDCLKRPGSDRSLQAEVLIAKCAAFTALGRIAEIEQRLLVAELDGRPAA